MTNNIIYSYNDASYSVLYHFSRYYGKPFLDFFSGSRNSMLNFFTECLFNLLNKHINPMAINNLLMIVVVVASVLSTYLMLRNALTGGNSLLILIISLLYSVGIFFMFRISSFTPSLYFIFFFPLTILLLFKEANSIFVGCFIFLALSFSNYYGFFVFILVCFWYLSDSIIKKESFLKLVKNIVFVSLPVLLGVMLFYSSLLRNNLTFSSKYNRETSSDSSNSTLVVYRPLEDWYNLSFRPWYFFIPPKSSLFFEDLSKRLYKKIESTNYYLADDYMEEEMGGSYMGWHFLLGMGFVAVLLLLKKFKKKEYPIFKTVYENQEMIVRSFFIIFCILLISGPPSFTIRGITFYTPSYLLYYIVPVFRTLVRWAVVIYLFVLIINSYLVQDLYDLMKNTWQKVLFIVVFLSLNFVIFAIKIPVINVSKPPLEIAYLKEKYPDSVPYAVYPKGDYYSIFWIISHEDLLINPVNFVNYETGFNSNEFSKNLITEEGIKEFLNHNPKYLIYYSGNISNEDLERINKINSNIKTREDIKDFFDEEFGIGIEVGKSVVFEVK